MQPRVVIGIGAGLLVLGIATVAMLVIFDIIPRGWVNYGEKVEHWHFSIDCTDADHCETFLASEFELPGRYISPLDRNVELRWTGQRVYESHEYSLNSLDTTIVQSTGSLLVPKLTGSVFVALRTDDNYLDTLALIVTKTDSQLQIETVP